LNKQKYNFIHNYVMGSIWRLWFRSDSCCVLDKTWVLCGII